MTADWTSPHVHHLDVPWPDWNDHWHGSGWYFTDEAGLVGGGPYPDREACVVALQMYAAVLNAERPEESKRV